MSWTPARAFGTFVVAGLTAATALLLSSGEVERPPADVTAGSAPTTTEGDGPPGPTTTTTSAPPTTTTTTEPPLTGPVRLVVSSRLDLRGIGPLEAGMTVHEAEEASGRRFRLSPLNATQGRCSSAVPDDLPGLTFVVAAAGGSAASVDAKAGTIARVTATDPVFATVSGAKVGSTLADARTRYAGRYDEVRFGRAGVALTIKGRSGPDADFGVRIESTDGQSVTSLGAGRLASLAAPDGCA